MRCVDILRSRSAMAVVALGICIGYGRTASAALFDITQPTDEILIVNGQNDGDGSGGNPPAAEGVANLINNNTTKYLNFLDLGSGAIINPALNRTTGGNVVTGIRFYTANDAEPRDPASYILEGSHTQSGPFTLISSGPLALPSGRNAAALPIDPATANSMQIGEIELLAVPEPGSLAVLGIGALGLLARRRA